MSKFDHILKRTKSLTVLYVEDDLIVQEATQLLLSSFFKKIIVANDGEEGLSIYHNSKEEIDIVISDIEMPKMNGLDMIQEIRKDDNDISIILTTAFSDVKYFQQAITLKVDRYLPKPINLENVIDVLNDISQKISDKKELESFVRYQHEQDLKDKANEIVLKISNAYALPTLIFKEQKVFYISESFKELFSFLDDEKLEKLCLENENLFIPKQGHLSSLSEYNDEETLQNKVKIKQTIGHKIYRVSKKTMELDGEATLYIFTDITLEEYQKTKIDSYINSVDNLAKKTNSTTIKERFISHETVEIQSAKEYIQTLSPVMLKDIQELEDLNIDLIHSIQNLKQSEILGFEKTSQLFAIYVESISYFNEFEDIYLALDEFSRLLNCINILDVDAQKQVLLVNFLESLREVLDKLRVSVFVEQTATNIHFLDSSIIRICIDLNILITHEL